MSWIWLLCIQICHPPSTGFCWSSHHPACTSRERVFVPTVLYPKDKVKQTFRSGNLRSAWQDYSEYGSREDNFFCRPVTLVLTAVERRFKDHMTWAVDSQLDSLQFAQRVGRGVDDAEVFIIDTVHKHVVMVSTTARLLFAYFSSALNTLQPHSRTSHHPLSFWWQTFSVADGRFSQRASEFLLSHRHSSSLSEFVDRCNKFLVLRRRYFISHIQYTAHSEIWSLHLTVPEEQWGTTAQRPGTNSRLWASASVKGPDWINKFDLTWFIKFLYMLLYKNCVTIRFKTCFSLFPTRFTLLR